MKLQNDILTNLSLAPGPQTAAELRDAVRRNGLKVEEFDVAEVGVLAIFLLSLSRHARESELGAVVQPELAGVGRIARCVWP